MAVVFSAGRLARTNAARRTWPKLTNNTRGVVWRTRGRGIEGGRKPSIFSRLYDRSRAVESVAQRRKVEDSFVNALWQIESMTAFAIQRDF